MAKEKAVKETRVEIAAPNLKIAEFTIRGDSPLVQSRFSQKAKEIMIRVQEAGGKAGNRKKREPKDFNAVYEGSMYKGPKGERGICASAFRSAMIDACRMAGYKMTKAKMSVFVEPDFFDKDEFTPLVKITKGKPHRHDEPVTVGMGSTDIAARGMWAPGWEAKVRVKYDSDQFSVTDVTNLLMRAGLQVGIGCGRPFSSNSSGCGWGTFEIVQAKGKK